MKGISILIRLNYWIVLFFLVQLSVAGDQKSESEAAGSAQISPAPTEISSDSMDFNIENHTAIFDGNVKVLDNQLRLNSDKMIVSLR